LSVVVISLLRANDLQEKAATLNKTDARNNNATGQNTQVPNGKQMLDMPFPIRKINKCKDLLI
jgi:hypothetical protein